MTGLLNQNVGFLINERFINIPAQVRVWFELPCTYSPSQTSSTSDQITVPLWETLVTEMRKARDRNLPFDFGENQLKLSCCFENWKMAYTFSWHIWIDLWHSGHYIMICKLYKSKTEAPNSHQPQQVIGYFLGRYPENQNGNLRWHLP